MLTALVQDMLIDALKVGYIAAKEGVNNLLFNVVGEVIVEIIQQGKMDSLMMGNIYTLSQLERFMVALT